MQREILLSVVMPTYNSDEYILRTLKSLDKLVDNGFQDVEVIFIDDGSSDNTVDKILHFTDGKLNYKLLKQKHKGVSQARNYGITVAKGKYVTFLDSDDSFDSTFLHFFRKAVFENLEPDIIFGDTKKIKEPKIYNSPSNDERIEIIQSFFNLNDKTSSIGNLEPGIAAKFFKIEFLKSNNLTFNPKLVISEDQLLNVETVTKANKILFLPNSFYRINGTHTLVFFNDNNLTGQVEFLNMLIKDLKPFGKKSEFIINRAKLNATCLMVDRYFGPLYIWHRMTLNEASQQLENVIKENKLYLAFDSTEYDSILSNRYVIFRRLLRLRLYRLCLILNKMLDIVKGYNRRR